MRDIDTRAFSQQLRDTNKKVVEMMLPGEMKKLHRTLDGTGRLTRVPVTA